MKSTCLSGLHSFYFQTTQHEIKQKLLLQKVDNSLCATDSTLTG